MLRAIICALGFIIAASFSAASAGTPNHAADWNGAEIDWRDARSGIYEASKSGRPVIMVFHTTWCPVCKRFREVFQDPRIVAESRNFVMILVDADAEKELNSKFSPDGGYVPRTFFMDSNGKVSDQLVGSDPAYPNLLSAARPDELLALMKKAHDVFASPSDGSTPAASGENRT